MPPAVPLPVPHPSSDPFAKVRSLGGTLVVMLGIRASMRAITYVVHRVTEPPLDGNPEEAFESMRKVEGVLLGVENLVTLVAMITFLVWIHRVFVAIRQSGGTTSWSPGWAVGGWFVPLANAVIPWLTVRDALKSLGRPTVLAGAWWITWLLVIPLTMMQSFLRQMFIMPELTQALEKLPPGTMTDVYEVSRSMFWPYFLLDMATWTLLLVIVSTVSKAGARRE
jgi:hypothetical protein